MMMIDAMMKTCLTCVLECGASIPWIIPANRVEKILVAKMEPRSFSMMVTCNVTLFSLNKLFIFLRVRATSRGFTLITRKTSSSADSGHQWWLATRKPRPSPTSVFCAAASPNQNYLSRRFGRWQGKYIFGGIKYLRLVKSSEQV